MLFRSSDVLRLASRALTWDDVTDSYFSRPERASRLQYSAPLKSSEQQKHQLVQDAIERLTADAAGLRHRYLGEVSVYAVLKQLESTKIRGIKDIEDYNAQYNYRY